MLRSDLQELRNSLPNFPEEVLKEWLFPYVKILGYPPAFGSAGYQNSRWASILSGKPLSWWAAVSWRHEIRGLSFRELSPSTQEALLQMRDAYLYHYKNAYSEILDGEQRLSSILRYVFETGALPSCLTLVQELGRLHATDGHHRLVAYYLNYSPKFRDQFPGKAAPFDHKLTLWIASPPQSA